MAVQLGVNAAGVVGDEGKLGIDRPGGGEGDPAQSVSHQERLQTKRRKISDLKTHSRQIRRSREHRLPDSQFHPHRTVSPPWWRTWWTRASSSCTSDWRQHTVNSFFPLRITDHFDFHHDALDSLWETWAECAVALSGRPNSCHQQEMSPHTSQKERAQTLKKKDTKVNNTHGLFWSYLCWSCHCTILSDRCLTHAACWSL